MDGTFAGYWFKGYSDWSCFLPDRVDGDINRGNTTGIIRKALCGGHYRNTAGTRSAMCAYRSIMPDNVNAARGCSDSL